MEGLFDEVIGSADACRLPIFKAYCKAAMACDNQDAVVNFALDMCCARDDVECLEILMEFTTCILGIKQSKCGPKAYAYINKYIESKVSIPFDTAIFRISDEGNGGTHLQKLLGDIIFDYKSHRNISFIGAGAPVIIPLLAKAINIVRPAALVYDDRTYYKKIMDNDIICDMRDGDLKMGHYSTDITHITGDLHGRFIHIMNDKLPGEQYIGFVVDTEPVNWGPTDDRAYGLLAWIHRGYAADSH